MEVFAHNLTQALHNSFIDKTKYPAGRYQAELLINQPEAKESVYSTFVDELRHCRSFTFSVAFITESGLSLLKSVLMDLKEKGVQGRILTSTYLSFNHPKIFRELLKIENVEVKLSNEKGFHSKGYIFDNQDTFSLIVGSSNLTAQALKTNYEWNLKITSHKHGEVIEHFSNQYNRVWKSATPLSPQWIDEYEKAYVPPFKENLIIFDPPAEYATNPLLDALQITPNRMQAAALNELKHLREEKENKGLIVSATGTGKTYLAAFDVRNVQPKRVLFLVHREQILIKAKKEFQKVLGESSEYFGLFSGNQKDTHTKYLFATVQTMSKPSSLENFDPNEFDYIIIDEAHRSGASSYLNILNYFTPTFLLGMTATPERTDDFNIYQLFDYNIAYEIRLQEALDQDILAPFHYFGVSDYHINGETIDETADLQVLVHEERIKYLIEKINYYSYSGETLRGLIFCSRKDEAHELSLLLNERGYKTKALTGQDDQEVREKTVKQLESGQLDYIITVDIFNEGIDIPSINQVIMLRQTQSSIIFIQQLGRGLRKHESKEYVTVIDFIGNYKNNYLIPIALTGDHSRNKDSLLQKMRDPDTLSGISAINFESVARERIYASLDQQSLSSIQSIKEAFELLKQKIGHTPYLKDFHRYGSIDPLVLFEKVRPQFKNLNQLWMWFEKTTDHLTDAENTLLSFVTNELLNGKRKHELLLLQALMKNKSISQESYQKLLIENHCIHNDRIETSVLSMLDMTFFTAMEQKKYKNKAMVQFKNKKYSRTDLLENALSSSQFFIFFKDAIETALLKAEEYDSKHLLTIGKKYTRKDACRLLLWDKNEYSTIYGYKSKHNTTPIFITYHKDNEIDDSIKYEDQLINPSTLIWYTRSPRTLASKEVQKVLEASRSKNVIHLFVKKDDNDGSDFYYLGICTPDLVSATETTIATKSGTKPIVKMNLLLDTPVQKDLFYYLHD